jgi:hypothetical protein
MKLWLLKVSAEDFYTISMREYHLRLIGISDLLERLEVLRWLIDSGDATDPRPTFNHKETRRQPEDSGDYEGRRIRTVHTSDDEVWHLQFLPRGLSNPWIFTKGDPDPYPSVPHGHLNHKNQQWPKLNPYSGRAFIQKDLEQSDLRLKRDDMISLWNDKDFRKHALDQIGWYQKTFPYHKFSVSQEKVDKLPKWRRGHKTRRKK